ncbi:helix-turn-helix domain-containing protein [Chloroflexota bacterium]
MLPSDFLAILHKAIRSGTEVTISELISSIQIPQNISVIDQVREVENTITNLNLILVPDIPKGDLDTVRVLRSTEHYLIDEESLIKEINRGETDEREFKSSLCYDHKRAGAVPTTKLDDLKSEEVEYSCLKTLGAFLTCAGGILFVGVNDSGDVIGIEYDYLLFKGDKEPHDAWENHLRNLIRDRFLNGPNINNYIQIDFINIESKHIVKIKVLKRKKLTFLMKDSLCKLYCRQGNRTAEIRMEEIEEFISLRKLRGWI